MDDDIARALPAMRRWPSRPIALFGPARPGQRLHRATAWLTAEAVARHAGWLFFFVLLAPLLGPRDYGLFMLAISGIAVVERLLSDAAAAALIRLDTRDEAHLSTAFTATAGLGAAVSLLLYGVTDAMPAMFDDPTFGDMFQSLSLLPLLSALTTVPLASLRRQGRTAALAASTATGTVAGGIIAVVLALAGAGAWSLVAQIVMQRFFEIAVLWGLGGHRVGLRCSRRHLAEFAGALDLAALRPAVTELLRQVPRLVIGILLGPTALGLYLIAARLCDALCDIVLAPLAWAAPPARLLRQASRIALPVALGSAALLPIVLPALLDARWWGAVLPAQILLLAALPNALLAVRRAMLTAAGRDMLEGRLAAAQMLSGILLIGFAVPYGLLAVAEMAVIHAGLAALVSCWLIGPIFGDGWRRDMAVALPPLAAAAAIGAALFLLAQRISSPLEPWAAAGLLLGVGCCGYAALLGLPLQRLLPRRVTPAARG
jgi:O-antigen/teichoic acid export membrane protein